MPEIEELKKKLEDLEKRISNIESMYRKEQPKIKITKQSITDLLLELKNEGVFDEPKSTKAILEILASKGRHYSHSSLTWPLQHAVRTGVLGRIKKDKKWAYVRR